MTANRDDHECIDPRIGDRWDELADASCPDDLRRQFEVHLQYCASCRLRAAVERRIAGELSKPIQVPAWRRARTLAGSGALVMAAGLALMLGLPPNLDPDGGLMRSATLPRIRQPLPDEAVLGGRPTFRWSSLPGATRYRLAVSEVGGDVVWETTLPETTATLPAADALEVGRRYRVRVEPVPNQAAPGGALHSSFRAERPVPWLAYRIRHGATAAWCVAAAGLLALVAGAFTALGSRNPTRSG